MQNGSPFVFLADNAHLECCGQPPRLTRGGDKFHSYFENVFGEQLVFQFDFDEGRGRLWSGDAGWGTPIEITETEFPVFIGKEERAWLIACWDVVTTRLSVSSHS